MSKIAVDVDDTLYSFSHVSKDALFRLAYERKDKSLFGAAYSGSTQWRMPTDIAGLDTWLEAIGISHHPDVIKEQIPFPGAADTIRALSKEGHSILYISNRSSEAEDATYDWLRDNGFPINERDIELVCTMEDKLGLVSDCRYIIDDRPKTLIEFIYDYDWQRDHGNEQRQGFGILSPYNENLTDIPNVYLAPSWAGLNYYLVNKNLLEEPAHRPLDYLER
jgi:hypothetical protein